MNLIVVAPNLIAMASNLIAMASNLAASDGLQPTSDGLQPRSVHPEKKGKEKDMSKSLRLRMTLMVGHHPNGAATSCQVANHFHPWLASSILNWSRDDEESLGLLGILFLFALRGHLQHKQIAKTFKDTEDYVWSLLCCLLIMRS